MTNRGCILFGSFSAKYGVDFILIAEKKTFSFLDFNQDRLNARLRRLHKKYASASDTGFSGIVHWPSHKPEKSLTHRHCLYRSYIQLPISSHSGNYSSRPRSAPSNNLRPYCDYHRLASIFSKITPRKNSIPALKILQRFFI